MTEIISINHETGDMSQYTSTVTDSGDLSISAGAALAGTSYGLSCLVDDANAITGTKTLVAPNTSGVIRGRFYIDPNNIVIPAVNEFRVLELRSSTQLFLHTTLFFGGGIYKLVTTAVEDDENTVTIPTTITDAPHFYEFLLTQGGGDGALTTWVDGGEETSSTDLNNDSKFSDFNTLIVGASEIYSAISGTLYLDEIIINDDGGEIGPAGQGCLTAIFRGIAKMLPRGFYK